MSLSIYKDSSVYYRAGDSSFENLEPTFVSISKAHKSTVNEVSFKNNITNGKNNRIVFLYVRFGYSNYRLHIPILRDF